MTIEKGSEVRFQHPITKQWTQSRVYDTCYQGDKTMWTIQVKIGEGTLCFKRLLDCEEV